MNAIIIKSFCTFNKTTLTLSKKIGEKNFLEKILLNKKLSKFKKINFDNKEVVEYKAVEKRELNLLFKNKKVLVIFPFPCIIFT